VSGIPATVRHVGTFKDTVVLTLLDVAWYDHAAAYGDCQRRLRALFHALPAQPITITSDGTVHNIATQAEFAAWVGTVFEGGADYGFARRLNTCP
jgi:hypothetical protein